MACWCKILMRAWWTKVAQDSASVSGKMAAEGSGRAAALCVAARASSGLYSKSIVDVDFTLYVLSSVIPGLQRLHML